MLSICSRISPDPELISLENAINRSSFYVGLYCPFDRKINGIDLSQNNQMNEEVLQVIRELAWPIGVAIIGYFLIRLIKTLDRVDKTCTRLDITVTKQEAEQAMFRGGYERDWRITENRLNDHAKTLDNHDRDIATLKERTEHGKKT